MKDQMHLAARSAGAVSLTYFKQEQDVWEKTEPKGRTSPVSEADLAVNGHLKEILHGTDESFGWLSEETVDDRSRFEKPYVWMIDPIDGTRAFLKGRPHFTICIALMEESVPILGLIFNPVTEELFFAEAGRGATLNGAAIRAPHRETLEGCRMIGPPDMFRHPDWPTPWPQMHVEQRNSMAYRMALVAKGEFDATVALSSKNDWDLAAATLIAEEAGARVTTHDGKALAFNLEKPRHPSVLCACPSLHEAILTRTQDLTLPYNANRG